MNLEHIDPVRWNEVWEADIEVLRNLRTNGDCPEIIRKVDASFRGPLSRLRELAARCSNFGFEVDELVEADEQGNPWLWLVRDQQTDDESMREFTMTYLQIEDAFGVECDGWGCIAQTEVEK